MYDNALCRWFNPDPMAESHYSQSQYHFSGNNPVNLIDKNGMWYDGYLVDYWGNFQQVNNIGGDKYDVIYSGAGLWDAILNWFNGDGFQTEMSITISPEFMNSHGQFQREEYIDMTGEGTHTIISDYYAMKDSKEAKRLFEFLVNNTGTKVEWLKDRR